MMMRRRKTRKRSLRGEEIDNVTVNYVGSALLVILTNKRACLRAYLSCVLVWTRSRRKKKMTKKEVHT